MLIVEDGTGVADAESYASLADAEAYTTAHGLSFPIAGADQVPAEQALRRATAWVDATWRSRFPGWRKKRREQALEWPRIGALDALCPPSPIDPDTIPVEIVRATIEAAVRERAQPGALSPDVIPGRIKRAVSIDSISVEYAIGSGSALEQRPVVLVIDGILAPLLGERASALFGEAERA